MHHEVVFSLMFTNNILSHKVDPISCGIFQILLKIINFALQLKKKTLNMIIDAWKWVLCIKYNIFVITITTYIITFMKHVFVCNFIFKKGIIEQFKFYKTFKKVKFVIGLKLLWKFFLNLQFFQSFWDIHNSFPQPN